MKRSRIAFVLAALAGFAAVAQEPAPEASTLAVVRGRCISKEDGKPLANCTVKFHGRPSNSQEMSRHGKPNWKDPEPFVTGDDGRFEFRFVPPPPYQHHLDIACEGRVPRTARWGAFEPGQVDDLGDIELQRGYELRGIVKDQHGKPVPRCPVAFYDLPLPIKGAANDVRYGSSKDDGTFVVETPMPPGRWPLHVDGRGLELVGPDSATVVAQDEPNLVNVRIVRMPSISGHVFDEQGRPVPRVYLQARPGSSNWATSSWSRNDGSFVIYKRDGSPDEVTLEIEDPGPCEIRPIEGTYEWETHGLRIELPRALSFELTVVEAGTGAPVEEFAIRCHPLERANHSLFADLRLGEQPHEGGKVVVDKVWRGKNTLQVLPRDPFLAPSAVLELDASPETLAPHTIELTRLASVALELDDGQGQGLTSAETWIVDVLAGQEPLLQRGHFHDPRGTRQVWSSDPLPQVIAYGKSDAEGRLRIAHAKPKGRLALVVKRPGTGPFDGFFVVVPFDPAAVDGPIVVE